MNITHKEYFQLHGLTHLQKASIEVMKAVEKDLKKHGIFLQMGAELEFSVVLDDHSGIGTYRFSNFNPPEKNFYNNKSPKHPLLLFCKNLEHEEFSEHYELVVSHEPRFPKQVFDQSDIGEIIDILEKNKDFKYRSVVLSRILHGLKNGDIEEFYLKGKSASKHIEKIDFSGISSISQKNNPFVLGNYFIAQRTNRNITDENLLYLLQQGLHLNTSLSNKNEENLFENSETGKKVLEFACNKKLEFLSKYLCMFANNGTSYHRIVEVTEDNYKHSLVIDKEKDNRPVISGRISEKNKEIYIENRIPFADCDPFLACAIEALSWHYSILKNPAISFDRKSGEIIINKNLSHENEPRITPIPEKFIDSIKVAENHKQELADYINSISNGLGDDFTRSYFLTMKYLGNKLNTSLPSH